VPVDTTYTNYRCEEGSFLMSTRRGTKIKPRLSLQQ
jgi:hypothetical protein